MTGWKPKWKHEDLGVRSSVRYSPNRKFCRHRRRIIRVMTEGMLDDLEAAKKKVQKRRVKTRANG